MGEVPDPIPADVRAEIDRRLTGIWQDEAVHPLLAIESGSRAWGFPSPDSDYDVRFIYLRPLTDYLSLKPVRDVIEQPIVDEIDLNGWDLRKALGLLLRHNAVVSEWIESWIRYTEADLCIAQIAELGDRFFNPRGYARHYASLAHNSAERWLGTGEAVPVKKYFYALRPALAVRVLRVDPSRRPPMRVQDLMARAELDSGTIAEIEEMVALKATTREAGSADARPQIDRLIREEIARVDEVEERDHAQEFAREANALFVRLATADA